MNWRRIALGVAAALSTVVVQIGPAAASTTHRADGNLSDWTGDPTMLSGQSRISHGELIYDDWLYDDYGADLDHAANPPAFRVERSRPRKGDYRYPTDSARYGYNAADLRELRVAADAVRPPPAGLPPDDEGARRGRLHARDRLEPRPQRHGPVAGRRRHRRAEGRSLHHAPGAPEASSPTVAEAHADPARRQ